MEACGVIVEYNPFHNGHLYHLQQARAQSKAEVVVAVMSGNFLQRGEPAVIDKWKRAEAALANGADLVVELPFEWAVQSADYFAKGAVAILQSLKCTSLCFGTDSAVSIDYQALGRRLVDEKAVIDQLFQEMTQPNLSYPEKMAQLTRHLFPTLPQSENSPNHILGLSYSQENAKYPSPMTLIPITRKSAPYHSTNLSGSIASATAIRQALKEERAIEKVVPSETAAQLLDYQVSWDDFWPFLQYQLAVQSPESLQQIYQMNEGIEYRLKEAAKNATHFDAFLQLVKTRRYTQVRIQRLCCYVLLNMKEQDIHDAWNHPSIRVLGFTAVGKEYLKKVKKQSEFPIIAKIGKQEAQHYSLTIRSDQVYKMAKTDILEQNFGRIPLSYQK